MPQTSVLSTRFRTISVEAAALPVTAAPSTADAATLRARIGGYVVDMVIFSAIAMVMLVIAGAVLLFSTDLAEQDPTDADTYLFLGIFGLGTPIVWTLLNIPLLASRGQTGGHYVAGLRLVREDGKRLSGGNATAWWFCLNPLLFSWPMALTGGLPMAAIIAIVLGSWTVAVFGLLITLCIAMPIIALISAVLDHRNRALHDRVIGTVVVPVE